MVKKQIANGFYEIENKRIGEILTGHSNADLFFTINIKYICKTCTLADAS